MIEEEKENTEQRAEETESREGRGSLGSLRRFKSVSSLDLHPASSHAGFCPPSSGRSKPRRRQHSLAREGDRLGITPLEFFAAACKSTSILKYRGGMGREMAGSFKREGIYVYLWLTHVEV